LNLNPNVIGITQLFANPKSGGFSETRQIQIFDFPFGNPFFIVYRTLPEKN